MSGRDVNDDCDALTEAILFGKTIREPLHKVWTDRRVDEGRNGHLCFRAW